MPRASANQCLTALIVPKPLADLGKLCAQSLTFRVGRVACCIGVAHKAYDPDALTARVMKRPKLQTTPPPLAGGVYDQGGAPARLAGESLRRRVETAAESRKIAIGHRAVGQAFQTEYHLRRVPRELLPRLVHVNDPARLIEYEDGFGRLLEKHIQAASAEDARWRHVIGSDNVKSSAAPRDSPGKIRPRMARAVWFDPRSLAPTAKASENVRDSTTQGGMSLGIVIDGGTTNTRARSVRDGAIAMLAARSVGVRDTVFAGRTSPLALAVRACIDEILDGLDGEQPDYLVAAGMLSSDAGLHVVPHVIAPAGINELARGAVRAVIPEVSPSPILFIPGVRTPPSTPEAWDEADVMRGEESETIGAWESLRPSGPSRFLWPGSHTKLVAVDHSGRITGSFTSLAGELLSAVARHTLIAKSLPDTLPDEPDSEAVADGARLARGGLGRVGFLVRLAEITNRYDARGRASLLLGAVVADDVAHMARHRLMTAPCPIWVGGRQPLRRLYAEHLAKAVAQPVFTLDDDLAGSVSALGALAIAARRREIE
jgi:2-dehydro-3-deoxygalactonokinase